MTDRYADIRAALDYSKQFRENCLVAFNSADIRALLAERDALREALNNLVCNYVYTLEAGRDRIVSLGGQCDPVDVMEARDPYLRAARAALAQEQGGSDGDR